MATKNAKAAEEAKAAEDVGHTVAEGISITSKRGTLLAGDKIEASYLSGGQASLDALIKAKKVK